MSTGRPVGALALLAAFAGLLLGLHLVPWHDAIVWPLVLGGAYALVERGRFAALFGLAAAALAIDLAYVWTVGYAGRNHVFAGVFALSDAQEYWADAERVLHGARMFSGGARRPIFGAVLAGVLDLTGNDIRRAHVVTLLFWAGAAAFAVNEVRRTNGRRVAGLLFVVFVLFARRYVGFVQSEGLGAPLGAIAFGLLWRSAALARTGAAWQGTFLGGLAVQSVALLARPGPMLVVVALVVWAAGRVERTRRVRLVLKSAAVVVAACGFQAVVRAATSGVPAFADAFAIFYGLLHGEDSRFLFVQHAWIHDPPDPAQSGAIVGLIGNELLARPWLVVVAPVRCLAAWFYLPQGFFGFVWANPDDRVLENHGTIGLWVRTLGVYSLVNAVAMGLEAVSFVGLLVRALVRVARQRPRSAELHVVVVIAILSNLPILPPWITEGAQILATVFLWIVALVAVSVFPEDRGDAPVTPAPRIGPVTLVGVAALVLVPKLFPVRLDDACHEGRVLMDVDVGASVTYGADPSPDRAANVALLARNNPRFAAEIAATLDAPHRLFPAYDGCRGVLVYVLDSERKSVLERRMWLATEPGPAPVLVHASTKTRSP